MAREQTSTWLAETLSQVDESQIEPRDSRKSLTPGRKIIRKTSLPRKGQDGKDEVSKRLCLIDVATCNYFTVMSNLIPEY